MWIPYEVRRKQPPDFKVKYRMFSSAEGGRKNLPFQGYRCDFAFEEDFHDHDIDLCVIHPEFEDHDGSLIYDDSTPVPVEGTARMWIFNPPQREHRYKDKIKIGLKGYFMEGPHKVAAAEVIEIIALHSNPITELKP